MYIDGFGISGYRSFGKELQNIGPFSKVNLFIGQNNSGKSNILLYIKEHYSKVVNSIRKNQTYRFDNLDAHIGKQNDSSVFSLCFPTVGERFESILERYTTQKASLYKLLSSEILTNGKDYFWITFREDSKGQGFQVDSELVEKIISNRVLLEREWRNVWGTLTNLGQGDIRVHWVPQTLTKIALFQIKEPKVDIIPAIRQVGKDQIKTDDYSGIDIIERLAKLQNPDHNEAQFEEDFNKINEFLRQVTGISSAQIQIPYARDKILIKFDGKRLPLTHLGTGIHEVIILASAATVIRGQVLCIEEPELHLHPLLQKKLIRYLEKNTDNQYFITTHSAHLLDNPNAAIFHVRYKEGASSIEPVYSDAQKSEICLDLGYRAADLMQANCVIWVEGPSDRLYLNYWIKALDNSLIEGVHYSIMFYGGRLLKHLSAKDPEVEEFISLRRLNRFISILIDSDRKTAHSPLYETKRRVRKEFDEGPGFAWITKGREIENYIPPDLLLEAVKKVHPSAVKLASTGQFDHTLYFKTKTHALKKEVDKVKVAHEVVKTSATLDVLDLRMMVHKLVDFIKESNDFELK